ncbi:hypothetical protein LA791_016065 [Clostridioides difficile]|uniref:hypothetical protein n=1 Tax=Clostridioides difficile TaxID=1496 RepID=UPI00093F50A6|nr:hypothetical protein [Clostridioides difficile]EGT5004824.1 hypothetical protein [Clostridioides difficile]EJA6629782.1 hypothetical protein [Clostridioides difficile]EKG0777098.1 hypothetical protein [Clostridioides difficile]EKG0781014.1 hypothetical protein [Clostridioides difficile]EKG0813098.1 hypothetical protein [Clostridioides difficile]
MDEKILELLKEMKSRFDSIDKRFDSIDKQFDNIENRLDGMDNRFDSIEKKQDILYNQAIATAENITEIREDLGDVQVTTTCNLNDLKELKKLKSVK